MVTQQRRIKLFLSIFLLVLFPTQANAASFDCKKASTWLEKNVCSNPELSKLDDQLAKAYHDALASLSPEGQKETKQYQRQWLKEISYIKAKHDKFYAEHKEFTNESSKDTVRDINISYKKRIEQLQQSLIKFPGRIFRNVYINQSIAEQECPYILLEIILTYPQIENPRNENEKIWNDFISKNAILKFKEYDSCQEMQHEYSISFCNRYLISFQGQLFWYTQDLPHGQADRVYFNWLLESKRELKATDLFDDKTDWQNKLTALVAQKVKKQEAADEETYEIGSDGLKAMVTSPSEWEISKDGLGFRFIIQYWRGPAALVIIDWKTLYPYLSKNGHSLIFD